MIPTAKHYIKKFRQVGPVAVPYHADQVIFTFDKVFNEA